MYIQFTNGAQVPIELNNSPAQDTFLSMFKHLQHVPLEFLGPDYPGRFVNSTIDEIVDYVVNYGKLVSVDVDRDLCLSKSHEYFNHLHTIYEKNYNGNPNWLMFHEHIHLCEYFIWGTIENRMDINYREKAGLLQKPFDRSLMDTAVTHVSAGDVYLAWTDLGKIPYTYWEHKEPNDIKRMCELAKPWRTFNPKFSIALSNKDLLENKDIENFNAWWANYSEQWCQHWKIPKWTIEDQYSAIVIGRVNQYEQIIDLLKNEIYPIKVRL